jgi:amidase
MYRGAFRSAGIDVIMDRHPLDALIAPTGNLAWSIDLLNGDHRPGRVTTAAAPVADDPDSTVPMSLVHGLQAGWSPQGRRRPGSLQRGFARGTEQATKHRRAPRCLTTRENDAVATSEEE